jgi:hypothetical protein
MKVGAAIYELLKNDSAVNALVSGRIFPELAVEGDAAPYIVYSIVSNTPVDTKDSAPVDEAALEIFSVASTYAVANDLADKVRAALSRKTKVVFDTVTVQSIQYTNEVVEVTPERDYYIAVQDYTVRTGDVVPELLLNTYPGAYAAYGLRRLNGFYNGPAVRLRRSSDNEELDIGFNSDGNLDTAASAAFYDGTNLQAVTWYDQSGHGRDTTQTQSGPQPLLYNNAGLLNHGGFPGLRFVGSDELPFDSTGLDIGNLSAFTVGKFQDTADTEYLLAVSGNADGNKRFQVPVLYASNFNYAYGGNVSGLSTAANVYRNLHTMIAGSTQGNAQAWLNDSNLGNLSLSSGIDSTDTGVGALNGFGRMDGFVFEIIVYDSDQSTNRAGIQANIMTHYNIT